MKKQKSLCSERCFSVVLCVVSLAAIVAMIGCKGNSKKSSTNSGAAQAGETGVEKVKPAPGTGNVQGKVLFNSKPAANIEVKLCETFSQYLSGCAGKIYAARTGPDGEYLITNVEPKTYQALTARVFDTDGYVFATTGIGISSAKYEVVADKTFFVNPINLFKSDLKTVKPKAGSKVTAQDLELKWEPYPDAAYYKFSTYAEDASVTSPYINERVESTSFAVNKPLPKGTYRFQVTAFNKDDRKISESSDDIKFTVNE
jgi:hypothetical protein